MAARPPLPQGGADYPKRAPLQAVYAGQAQQTYAGQPQPNYAGQQRPYAGQQHAAVAGQQEAPQPQVAYAGSWGSEEEEPYAVDEVCACVCMRASCVRM